MALAARREDDPRDVNYLHRRRAAAQTGGGGLDPLFAAQSVIGIRIQDSGPGIPPEHIERVFDPFFTTKAPGKGTGLGLAICAQLVESMGGRIAAENVQRGGAAFTLRIPAAPAEEAGAPASGEPSSGSARAGR
jgi:signal transduction histidine kinase